MIRSAPEDKTIAAIATVLVVEDEAIVRLAVADYLQGCGFEVIEADNGAEAISLLETGMPVDVIVSDIQMPRDPDGLALARWVREHRPGLKVILASGQADRIAEGRDRSLAEAFYDKPLPLSRLAEDIIKLARAS